MALRRDGVVLLSTLPTDIEQSAHETVLLEEAVSALVTDPDGLYVDGTFGRGGHSRLILAQLGPRGRLIALDRDPQAVAAAREIRDARFAIVHAAFSGLAAALDAQGVREAHGMLFDLGVSSPQLEEPVRGFSFRADGPLDMRMDPTQGQSAADWLAGKAEDETVIRRVADNFERMIRLWRERG